MAVALVPIDGGMCGLRVADRRSGRASRRSAHNRRDLHRHAQSGANVAGIVDTAVPGPDITDLGRQQAQDVANQLSVNRYDGIYASTMVRTQETVAPMSEALDESVTVLPGLRELEAGANEGLSVTDAPVYRAPGVWLDGYRSERIPGSVTGDEFDARFDTAMQSIYAAARPTSSPSPMAWRSTTGCR
jgi:broad specificity phosphatase PhoE